MIDYIVPTILFTPIFILLLTYIVPLFLIFYTSKYIVKKDYSYKPMVSIILPSYNEGAHVYDTVKSIMDSDYPYDKFEVIAIDDCSTDDSFQWLEKAKKEFNNIVIERNIVNSGKPRTVANAVAKAKGEIIICIDSDCIYAKSVITELVACFSEPNIVAVGGRVGVSNPNVNLLTQGQTFLYYSAFHIVKISQNISRTIFCISGCLFAVKKDKYIEIEQEVLKRNWLGISVNDGEDFFMTMILLLKGYKTYLNNDAQCL